MKKNLLMIILVLGVIFNTLTMEAGAKDVKVTVKPYPGSCNIPQETINGKTFVPVVPVLKALGWDVCWNAKHHTITGKCKDQNMVFKLESTDVEINKKHTVLDAPVISIHDRAFVLTRFIAQQFGTKIKWNKKDNLIILTDDAKIDVNGESNIAIVGNGIIVNIFEPYNIETANDIVKYSDALLYNRNVSEAIEEYKNVLENVSQKDYPDLYFYLLCKTGSAYALLSETESQQKNILNSISYLGQALKNYTIKCNKSEYINAVINQGNNYRILGELKGSNEYLKEALRLYGNVTDINNKSLEYAMAKYDTGLAYIDLKDVKSAKASLLTASDVFHYLSNICSKDENPLLWATIRCCLGNVCQFLYQATQENEYLLQAESLYEEALDIKTLESYPKDYASIHENIGDVAVRKYEAEKNEDYLNKAMEEYKESLKIYRIDRYPVGYSEINYKLGNIYLLISSIKDRESNLTQANTAYKEALKVFNASEYPVYYKTITNNLAKTTG